MDLEQKLQYLQIELNSLIMRFKQMRDKEKVSAFSSKITVIFLSAVSTVLLGLHLKSDPLKELFKNIAFVLGVIIGLCNSIEAFCDFRTLWLKRSVTLAHLYTLQRELNFYVSGAGKGELEEKPLKDIKDQINIILDEDIRAWLKLSEQTESKSENGKQNEDNQNQNQANTQSQSQNQNQGQDQNQGQNQKQNQDQSQNQNPS